VSVSWLLNGIIHLVYSLLLQRLSSHAQRSCQVSRQHQPPIKCNTCLSDTYTDNVTTTIPPHHTSRCFPSVPCFATSTQAHWIGLVEHDSYWNVYCVCCYGIISDHSSKYPHHGRCPSGCSVPTVVRVQRYVCPSHTEPPPRRFDSSSIPRCMYAIRVCVCVCVCVCVLFVFVLCLCVRHSALSSTDSSLLIPLVFGFLVYLFYVLVL
jgi:hypothetical protein